MIEVHLELDGEHRTVVRDVESFLSVLESDGVEFRRGEVVYGPELNRQRTEVHAAHASAEASAPKAAVKGKAKKK